MVLPDVAQRTPPRAGRVQLRRVAVPSGSASAAATALLADLAEPAERGEPAADEGGPDPLDSGLLVVHALEDEATADALRCLRAQHRPRRGGPIRVLGVPLGPTPLAAATAAELLVRALTEPDPGTAPAGAGRGLPSADAVSGPAGLPLLAALLAGLAGRLHVSALCPRVGHLADPAPTLADHVRGWLPGQRFLVRRSPQPAVTRLGADGLGWGHLLAEAAGVAGAADSRGLADGLEAGEDGDGVDGLDGLSGWELVVWPDQAVARWAVQLLEPLRADGVPQRWLPRTPRRDDVVRRGGVELVLVPGPAAQLVAGELAALTPAACGWCGARAVPPSCAACGAGVRARAASPAGAVPLELRLGSLAGVP
ncbi:MAG: hypothetical protein ACTHOD_16400 [Motilibacteraceae bacterium]